MVAVNPTRLRFQIADLLNDFTTPANFHRGLSVLFDFYANRSLRSGESIKVQSVHRSYNLPHPVTRQLKIDLKPRAQQNTAETLALADELWMDPYLEVKQVAIYLLNQTPVDDPQPILDRLQHWLAYDIDRALISDIWASGASQLQTTFPAVWESFIQSYLGQQDPKSISIGLSGLRQSLEAQDFKNTPVIFRLISPLVRNPQNANLKDLRKVIEALAQQSPTETAYFLHQMAALSDSVETKRLIKQCLPEFPQPLQAELKADLK